MLGTRVEAWRDQGRLEEVNGRKLWVYRRDGEGPTLLLLHGFPSSSYDWRGILDALPHRAAIAFDCLGFGLSDKPAGFEYTLGWQADAAEALVGDTPVQVVAHDMGTSVATELFARDIEGRGKLGIRSALLFNGSILLHRASPTPGQKLLRSRLGPLASRLNSQRSFRLQFARIFSKAHPLTAEEAEDQWALLVHNAGHRRLHETINYMNERERYVERWHGAIRDWAGELHLAWGLKDPVATTNVLAGLRELRPQAPVTELPELGHYPQIEAPERIAAAISAASPAS